MNGEFARRLKNLRTSEGMTQKDLAARLGVGRTTVVEYEKGTIYPKHAKLLMIAELFGVSIDYLSGNEAPLTDRDNRDISRRLNDIIGALDAKSDLMFDGEIMDAETKELLRASLENSFQVGKLIAKQKYTSKGKMQHGKKNKES